VCANAERKQRSLLNGGVPGGSVTELTGESTVGKTQLCLQLLLTAQLPEAAGGLGGRALYIHTEGPAPLSRLASLAACAFPDLRAPCDAVLVANASAGPEQLYDVVQQARTHPKSALARLTAGRFDTLSLTPARLIVAQAAALAAAPHDAVTPPVRLIVVDSITNPFRDLDGGVSDDMALRALLLYRISCALKEIAHRRVPLLQHAHTHAAPHVRTCFAGGMLCLICVNASFTCAGTRLRSLL
jgi:DNA-repair protein XRCC3